ncbi:MAG: PAS domain S-box protein, partial [Thermodesulfovibrionales bacterium]
YHNRKLHVVLADMVYWFTIGLAWILIIFYVVLDLQQSVIMSVYLKSFMNGIFYSLLGSMLNNALRSLEYAMGRKESSLTIRSVIFEIILISIIIPSVLYLFIYSKEYLRHMETDIKQRLISGAKIVTFYLNKGYNASISDQLRLIEETKDIKIAIVDKDGGLINRDLAQRDIWLGHIKRGTIINKGEGVLFWMPEDRVPALIAFDASVYFIELRDLPKVQGSIFLMVYMRDYLKRQAYIVSSFMTIALGVMLLFSVIAYLTTSGLLIKPLLLIVQTGQSISDKIAKGEDIYLPKFFIFEFDYISHVMKRVFYDLKNLFQELHTHRQQLQYLIDEKTRQLNETIELYKNVTENVNDIVYKLSVRPHLSLQYINSAVMTILGYSPNELINNGKILLTIIHPEDRRRFKESLKISDRYNITTLRWISKSGEVVYLEHKNTYIFNTNANLIAVDGVARDITERRRLAELFRESAQRFRVLFERSPYAIFIVERTSGQILDANSQAERLTKTGKIHLIGRNLPSFIYLSTRQTFMDIVNSSPAGNGIKEDFQIITADGKMVPVAVETSIIEIEGKEALSVVCRDISERKRHEQEMKNALQEKEMLIREIHHRVKNNMQVILSLINIQLSLINNQQVRSILTDLDSRIRSMAIVHETLYQSQELSLIDLREYTNKLVQSLNNSYARPNIKVVVSCDSITIPFEQAIKIGLILNETVSNAMKHAFNDRDGGLIDIGVFMIDDRRLRIVVSDNGVGITDDVLNRKSTSLGFQMIGLMTKQMDGIINIKSNNGTEISIDLKRGDL